MNKVSPELLAMARNDVARIIQGLNSTNQSKIAEQIGIDPGTLSKWKNDKQSNGLTFIENCCVLLRALEIKPVPVTYRMIREEKLQALFVMSKAWMGRMESVDDLFQDDISDFGMDVEFGYRDIKKA